MLLMGLALVIYSYLPVLKEITKHYVTAVTPLEELLYCYCKNSICLTFLQISSLYHIFTLNNRKFGLIIVHNKSVVVMRHKRCFCKDANVAYKFIIKVKIS